MGKLIKVVVFLVLVGGGIALAVHYAGGGDEDSTPTEQAKSDGVQVQEKYGFAPMGDE